MLWYVWFCIQVDVYNCSHARELGQNLDGFMVKFMADHRVMQRRTISVGSVSAAPAAATAGSCNAVLAFAQNVGHRMNGVLRGVPLQQGIDRAHRRQMIRQAQSPIQKNTAAFGFGDALYTVGLIDQTLGVACITFFDHVVLSFPALSRAASIAALAAR